jgi:uncharacterized protein with PQ loop repeat
LRPFSAQLIQGLAWVNYGILTENIDVILPNVVSFSCACAYTLVFVRYAPGDATWLPGKAIYHTTFGVTYALFVLHVCTSWARNDAVAMMGQLGVVFQLVMYAGPLTSAKTVLATGSTATLSLPLASATFVNCGLWSAYGMLTADSFITFPSIVGVACASLQLALFSKFPSAPPKPST